MHTRMRRIAWASRGSDRGPECGASRLRKLEISTWVPICRARAFKKPATADADRVLSDCVRMPRAEGAPTRRHGPPDRAGKLHGRFANCQTRWRPPYEPEALCVLAQVTIRSLRAPSIDTLAPHIVALVRRAAIAAPHAPRKYLMLQSSISMRRALDGASLALRLAARLKHHGAKRRHQTMWMRPVVRAQALAGAAPRRAHARGRRGSRLL